MQDASKRGMRGLRTLGLAALVSVLALPSEATVIKFQPSTGKDALITLNDGLADTNIGNSPWLTDNRVERNADAGLLEFDLGWLAGITVNSATLVLYHQFNSEPGGSVGVFLNTSPWSEGTVTWNSAPTHNPVPTSVLVIPDSLAGVFRSWDLTSAVQDWISGAPNYGVRIQRTDQVNSEVLLASSDTDLSDSFNPAIIIDFTGTPVGTPPPPEPGTPVPEPGTLLLLGSGLVGLGSRLRRAS